MKNQPYAVRFLLDHHLANNTDDDSPFGFEKRLEVAQTLIETSDFAVAAYSKRTGETPLHRGAARSEVAFMKQLVGAGVPVDLPSGVDGHAPLIDAMNSGQAKAIVLRLEAGATPDIDCQMLAVAACKAQFETAKYLLARASLMTATGSRF